MTAKLLIVVLSASLCACISVPQSVRAELTPAEPAQNHFAASPGADPAGE